MKQNKTIHYSNLTEQEEKVLAKEKKIKNVLLCLCGSTIYTFSFVWILQLCGFFGGGVTGVSQLIVGLVNKFSHNEQLKMIFTNSIGTLMILLNIPLLLFGSKGVSKKFAILTLVSIVLQGILSNILSTYTISPFVTLISNGQDIVTEIAKGADANVVSKGIIDLIQSGEFKLFKAANEVCEAQTLLKNTMLPGTRMLLAILGGCLCGLGCSMCLKGGGSTGGLDIISNYLYNKKQTSFTKFQTTIDTCIIALSSIFSLENVLYTLIRLYSYSLTIHAFYKSYNIYRVEIITSKSDEMVAKILQLFKHGLTINESVGGYTKELKHTIIAYVSEFEIPGYINVIKDVDEHAFVTVSPSTIMRSNFVKRTIC